MMDEVAWQVISIIILAPKNEFSPNYLGQTYLYKKMMNSKYTYRLG